MARRTTLFPIGRLRPASPFPRHLSAKRRRDLGQVCACARASCVYRGVGGPALLRNPDIHSPARRRRGRFVPWAARASVPGLACLRWERACARPLGAGLSMGPAPCLCRPAPPLRAGACAGGALDRACVRDGPCVLALGARVRAAVVGVRGIAILWFTKDCFQF